ncbi:MAG TPA: trypsin-like peptidase domain-containing protein [Terriglobia bacterium]|nr:trypsin-like peptidase domain-containing protein [Terriglobia bacterium]
MNKRGLLPAVVVAVTLGVGIVIGTIVSRSVRADRPFHSDARLLGVPSPTALSESFARVADSVGPAVVNIKTESDVRVSRRKLGAGHDNPGDDGSGDGDDAPFQGFFDHFFHFGGPPGSIPETSLGSGVILDPSGYILTNCHVIMRDSGNQPVDRMRVFLADDDDTAKGHPARIVGYDRWTDLAVIKIDSPKPLAAATLGNSDSVRVGDWALAIGSPFGLNSTVTAGIISAKGRGIEPGRQGEFKHFIQTDAAINPGNSGGPLVNLGGQVIGINTAIATERDAYDGVGFAIPSNTAREIYNDLVRAGQVRRGAIGVTFVNGRNQAVLEAMGADHGVVIESVGADTPAERAGLHLGDIITAVDSKPTPTGDDLLNLISETSPGSHLKVSYLRDGKSRQTDLVVGDWNKIVGENDGPPAKPAAVPASIDSGKGQLGLAVKNLTTDQARAIARDLRLSSPEGVVVTDARLGSFADDVGLGRFDVILTMNRQPVLSVDDFDRIQAGLKPGQSVLFLVARESDSGFTTQYLADKLP